MTASGSVCEGAKFNGHEITEWAAPQPGLDGLTPDQIGMHICELGVGAVVLSPGSAGALSIQKTNGLHTYSTVKNESPQSDVGPGNALLGGLVSKLAEGASLEAGAAFGVACGTASLTNHVPGRIDLETVEEIAQRIISSHPVD